MFENENSEFRVTIFCIVYKNNNTEFFQVNQTF